MIVQDLESKLDMKLNGLSNQMQLSFNSLESNLMLHTTMVMDQIFSFEQTLSGKLDTIICNQERFDIYPNLRHLQNGLNAYSRANAIQKELRLNDTVKTYRSKFEDVLVTDLLRAIRGDPSPISPSKSLVEIEMGCYNQKEACSDQYHKAIRTQEAELLSLYFRTRQFEKLLIANFPDRLYKTESDIDQAIEGDLETIVKEREKASCPAFINDHLIGGGCNARSTYKNQILQLSHMCVFEDTSPVYTSFSAINGERYVHIGSNFIYKVAAF